MNLVTPMPRPPTIVHKMIHDSVCVYVCVCVYVYVCVCVYVSVCVCVYVYLSLGPCI